MSRYWNTIRYLKPEQIFGRVWYRIARPRVDLRPAPAIRRVDGAWAPVAERASSMEGPHRFRFLNEVHDLEETGWDDPRIPTLWRYHLDYFDDLNAHDAGARTAWHDALLPRWVRENPPGGGTGWQPYPASRRIVNWVKWSLEGHSLPGECIESLAVQARWLMRRLETHLLGNHLFANAKALVFAGLYFEGAEPARWLERGLRILAAQVPEQILADGGQFELSPMYHALALEDMADLCNVSAAYVGAIAPRRRPPADAWRELIGPMRGWLAAMSHPDGEISFFNDAAMKIAPAPIPFDEILEVSRVAIEVASA